MSELMYARTVMAKKLNVMVRKIEGVTSFVLTGNDEYTPGEIYFVVAAADDSALSKVYADLNFLIREILRPIDIQKKESEGRTLVNYVFDDGLKAQVVICNEKKLPPFEWWMPYMDKNGAARDFYAPSARKASDPTTEDPRPEPDVPDDFDVGFEDTADEPAVEAVPVQAVRVPVKDLRPEKQSKDVWNYFYGRVNVAKHAISGGSVIYACETIGELRTLLIRMICEANGITEDYLHSIDLLPENHRAALLKTYPSRPENGPMISALAAELSIFEELMKRSSR